MHLSNETAESCCEKGKGGRESKRGESLWCVKKIQSTVSIYSYQATKLPLPFCSVNLLLPLSPYKSVFCLSSFLFKKKKKKSVSISKQKLALQGKMYLWLTLLSNIAVASGDDGNTTGRQYKGWKLKSCLCLLYIQWWVSKSVQCWI